VAALFMPASLQSLPFKTKLRHQFGVIV